VKKYKEYMDGVTVSDTLHEKLRHLEQPKKKPQVWKKYGAMAAALVLVLGLGGWGLSRRENPEIGHEMAEGPVASMPAIEAVGEPDIAPVPVPMPNSPGMEMMGGYEVNYGESVAYFYLPAINYGEVTESGEASLALPVGTEIRDLTAEEIETLLGGEINLTAHLDWGDYEVSAHAVLWPDDTMWMLCVSGTRGDTGLEHFLLEVSPGQLPPTCTFYAQSELNNIWERDVYAERYDSIIASSRRVSFVDRDYGYRFEITGLKAGEIEELTSRLVRFIIAGGGLRFAPDSAEPVPPVGTGEMNTPAYEPPDPVSTPTMEP
jgi:hypothetical protein